MSTATYLCAHCGSARIVGQGDATPTCCGVVMMRTSDG